MNALTRLLIPALALLLAGLPVQAQFGKNKIAYDRFKWHIYHAPHFDVYYYPEEEKFLQEIVSYAESAYLKISKDLDHELKVRVPLIIYKTHGEFEQTNVTLAELPEGVGAFAEPVQYRMVLPIDEPPDKLYKLVAHELVHIFEYSMFFGGSLGRTLRARPPTWIMEGLASYLAEDEDSLDRMVIRDAVVNNLGAYIGTDALPVTSLMLRVVTRRKPSPRSAARSRIRTAVRAPIPAMTTTSTASSGITTSRPSP